MTLVELMVTLVIISILTSLSMAGLAVARNSARKSKTEATIRKISEIILPYYEQYETRRPTIGNVSVVAATGGRKALTELKQVAIRRLMTLELPERASDYRDALTLPDGTFGVRPRDVPVPLAAPTVTGTLSEIPPAARRYYALTNALITSGTLPTSSELLHLIVTRGPVADPDIIAHFREDEVRDVDGNGLPEFVDGWNRRIAFCRWPIGFASPMQPIDGTVRGVEPLVSSNGHRLVPLIFSAGLDGSYDIEAMGSLSYFALKYDPFPSSAGASAIAIPPQDPAVAGSVVLQAVSPPSGSVTAPVVFKATRLAANAAIPAGAFQTVGSERDTGSADGVVPNGVVESRDNIHNHDMTR